MSLLLLKSTFYNSKPTSFLCLTRLILTFTRCCSLEFITDIVSAKRFTPDHEYVKFDDSTKVGTMSITDYAQKALGDVVFVELPTIGAVFGKGGTPISLHRICSTYTEQCLIKWFNQ